MAKTLIQSVVKQLQQERARLENELHGVTAALTTFGKVFLHGKSGRVATHKKRTISAAGRKRIAAAQRARWARVRAAKKKKVCLGSVCRDGLAPSPDSGKSLREINVGASLREGPHHCLHE